MTKSFDNQFAVDIDAVANEREKALIGPLRLFTAIGNTAGQREDEEQNAILCLAIGDENVRCPEESVCTFISIDLRCKTPHKQCIIASAAMHDGTLAAKDGNDVVSSAAIESKPQIVLGCCTFGVVWIDRISRSNELRSPSDYEIITSTTIERAIGGAE
ncbi:hypothetical protein [Pelagibius sp. 7325]|uniref:hypothetical protein n=1 Tax=Pelagibius sp. 7325 TaxID=3131994 RepID=UPI0030EB3C13